MLHMPLLLQLQDHDASGEGTLPAHRAKAAPRSFLDVLGDHLDRRYAEEKERRVHEMKSAPRNDTRKNTGCEDTKPPDFAMYKLYMSLLLRLGGTAPVMNASDPDATAVMHQSLKAQRHGARAPFSRDSDLYSMPQFPVTRVE